MKGETVACLWAAFSLLPYLRGEGAVAVATALVLSLPEADA